jgi:uridine phosphorylase
MSYQHMGAKEIGKWLGIAKKYVPKHVIFLSKWPWTYKNGIQEVRKYIDSPRSASKNLNNFYVGRVGKKKVGFSFVYGGTIAIDMLWPLASMGAKYIYNIGYAGSLQKDIGIGSVLVPSESEKFEGLSHHFERSVGKADKGLLKKALSSLEEMSIKCRSGKSISIDFFFGETNDRVERWNKDGFLGIDLETASIYAAARKLNMKAVSLLTVSDNLVKKELLGSKKSIDGRRKNKKLVIRAIRKVISESD